MRKGPRLSAPTGFGLRAKQRFGDLALVAWEKVGLLAAIGHHSARARRFAAFGVGSAICFPPAALFGEGGIRIGTDTLIGPFTSLSAGMLPGQSLLSDEVLVIGDRCLIGRHSSIVAHLSVVVEDDVFFGPNVYVTDQNHGHTDRDVPIGLQVTPERPVRIGAGSWIGTNCVILPGVTIGKHVVVAAGSVVNSDVPDYAIVAGAPATVVKDQLSP